jgi:hypothetical protein
VTAVTTLRAQQHDAQEEGKTRPNHGENTVLDMISQQQTTTFGMDLK